LLSDRELARAGDQLRVEMMQTRLLAMRTGRTQVMQLQLSESKGRVKPFFDANDLTEAVDQTGNSSAIMAGGNATIASLETADATDVTREFDLPAGVTTTGATVQGTARSFMVDNAATPETGEGWSQSIIFYPDGTTSTAGVTLAREIAGRVIVVIRGLTGEVTVTDVLAPADGL